MELREKIIVALECVPVKVGQTYAEAIADTVLAIPEIREALETKLLADSINEAMVKQGEQIYLKRDEKA